MCWAWRMTNGGRELRRVPVLNGQAAKGFRKGLWMMVY